MKDPIGQALLDYLHTKRAGKLLVHSDIATVDEIPVPYLFRSWKKMPEVEQRALNLCKGRVLDIGAGAGSHSLWLQKRGFDVTAIDSSPGAVKVMNERGVKNVVLGDIYDHQGKYDTLLMLMNGIGIASTLNELRTLLSHFRSLLNPNGQVIFDSSDIRYMFEEEDGSIWVDINSDYYGEVEYQFEYDPGDKGKSIKGDPFSWLFVDFPTMKTIASEVGFDAELVFDDGRAYLGRME